jgi:hypothetical protein
MIKNLLKIRKITEIFILFFVGNFVKSVRACSDTDVTEVKVRTGLLVALCSVIYVLFVRALSVYNIRLQNGMYLRSEGSNGVLSVSYPWSLDSLLSQCT